MGYSARNGKFGFECDVCGRFVGDLRLSNSCRRCHKLICTLCSFPHFFSNSLPPQLLRYRKIDKPSYVCPDCKEELDTEEIEVKAAEEEESPRSITTCQICGADDGWDGTKTFPSGLSLSFSNCDRCGRLGCDNCISGSPGGHYEYYVICRECYQAIEQEEARERVENWREREEEENKLEE